MSWIKRLFSKKSQTEQCTIHSVACSLCTEKDKMYSFKVSDYITEIVGRKNEQGNFLYIQRGDGAVHKYDADRITQATELNYR
tara:strand:+ start:769 stop:1017 length:249 start_codon:yes stop_codon:yes gene_type:complete